MSYRKSWQEKMADKKEIKMNILLSIKPEYADKIISGEKKV